MRSFVSIHFRIYLIVLIFFTSTSSLLAQGIKNFTSEPQKFDEEMKGFLMETDKKEGEKIMEAFDLVWKGSRFTADQQQAIYKTSNAMLRKRMKAFPDFKNYIIALTSFANSTQTAQSFASWQASLDKLLLLPSKYFANYMITCNNLFKGNTLYESASTNWHSNVNNYSFDFDSIPKIVFATMNLVCTSKGDSSIIYDTKGVLYPTRQLFFGTGGKVNWVRAGWDASVVHAELSNYQVDV
ncbi:MAG TPA: hypothetical protein PKK99_10475, partial [Bacteroidia bacterium]|nr:hypothetical protein [Bacteroidia bacterium]